jgi:urease accessory protein
MITVNHILGNIYKNLDLEQKYDEMKKNNNFEQVVINRSESQKLRMRKNTDNNTDVVFIFDHTPHLRNGDVVFLDAKKMVLLTLEPELVAIITLSSLANKRNYDDDFFTLLVKIGHSLGNLHRPIKVTKNQIVFPIQAETELEMLKKMFSSFGKFIDIKTDTVIFEPDEGSNIHEH